MTSTNVIPLGHERHWAALHQAISTLGRENGIRQAILLDHVYVVKEGEVVKYLDQVAYTEEELKEAEKAFPEAVAAGMIPSAKMVEATAKPGSVIVDFGQHGKHSYPSIPALKQHVANLGLRRKSALFRQLKRDGEAYTNFFNHFNVSFALQIDERLLPFVLGMGDAQLEYMFEPPKDADIRWQPAGKMAKVHDWLVYAVGSVEGAKPGEPPSIYGCQAR